MDDDLNKLKEINKKNKLLRKKRLLKVCHDYGAIGQIPLALISYGIATQFVGSFIALTAIATYSVISATSYVLYRKSLTNMEYENTEFDLEHGKISDINKEIEENNEIKEQIKTIVKTRQEKIKDLEELKKSYVNDTIEHVKKYTK